MKESYNIGEKIYHKETLDVFTIVKEYDFDMYRHYDIENINGEGNRLNCGALESRFYTEQEFRLKKLKRLIEEND